MVSFEQVKNDPAIRVYIRSADNTLKALGYTEHSFAHVEKAAVACEYILGTLGFDERTVEIAKIAAFMHDIGNIANRIDHSQSGAVMAFRLLDKMGMEPEEIALIVAAIGNHDEGTGVPVDNVSAALILADKSDVRRTRVRNNDMSTFDIHDRVNFSVTNSDLTLNKNKNELCLFLTVDTEHSSIMDYFEIFLERMNLCRRAAEKLGLKFRLIINEQFIL